MSQRLHKMPNGEYVFIDDNASPEAIEKVRAAHSSGKRPNSPADDRRNERQSRATRPGKKESDHDRRVRERADRLEKGGLGRSMNDSVITGLISNFDDELSGAAQAATTGVFNAIRKGDVGQIGEAYRVGRDTENELKRRYRQQNPGKAAIGEIGGAVLMPLGTGARGLQAAGKALGSTRLTNLGTRLANAGPVVTGIAAGGIQGGINAAGASEDLANMPGDFLRGTAGGAIFGGGTGALFNAGRRAVQKIRDRNPINAEREAYGEVGRILERGKLSPERAESTLRRANQTGNDMAVMDLTPGASSVAGKISRDTDVPAANDLIEMGQRRWEARSGRIEQKIEKTAELPAGRNDFDALTLDDALKASRKAQGGKLYEDGGALDNPIAWSDDLETFFRESPDAGKLIQQAYTTAQRYGQKLGDIAEGGQAVPSMRAFDYLKREFDGVIGQAMRAGNPTLAGGLSAQLGRLKTIIADANPQWKPILAQMRDAFQKEQALKVGQDTWKLVRRQPRQALRQVKSFQGDMKDNARIGIIDSFVQDALAAGDPTLVMRAVMRNKHQAKILEWAFGDRRRLAQFEKFIRREFKSAGADAGTRYGGQSITSRMSGANSDTGGDMGMLAREGAAGGMFGGIGGAFANISRRLARMSPTSTVDAQDAIARILMSDGKGLAKGINDYLEFAMKRQAANKRWATYTSKAAQQPITTEIGGE